MESFFHLKSADQVIREILKFERVSFEGIRLNNALKRVLYQDVVAPEDLPTFSRSTVDGYAVRARDSFGASESSPLLFMIAGEIAMGKEPEGKIRPGTAMKIPTGGVLPEGADAVVMIEYTEKLDDATVEINRPVSPFENVIQKGEDVKKGEIVLSGGWKIRPQDIGLLAALGITDIKVYKRPHVAVISTGDEIVPINVSPPPGKIRDVNGASLSAMCEEEGAIAHYMGIVEDNFDQLMNITKKALEFSNMIIISGGSSVGTRDYTLKVLESLPDSEILVHGISISPGKPTILGRSGSKIIWGLPGHVASSIIVFYRFVSLSIRHISGMKVIEDYKIRPRAIFGRNIKSKSGREDYIRVSLKKEGEEWYAYPLLGKSGLISPLVKADGLVTIGVNEEGLMQGEEVEIQWI